MLSTAHFSFTVGDLERSLGFYRDTLGMELVGTMDRQGDDISRIVAFDDAHLKIAFLELPRAAGVQLRVLAQVWYDDSTRWISRGARAVGGLQP